MIVSSANHCILIIKSKNPKIHERDISQNSDGLNCYVFMVGKTVYRFPKTIESMESMEREIVFLHDFSSISPVRVPNPQKQMVENSLLYCTYDQIPGDGFRDDWASEFSDEKRLAIASNIGKFLSVLHSYPQDKAKKLSLEEKDIEGEMQESLADTKKELESVLSAKESQWIDELYNGFFSALKGSDFIRRVTQYEMMPKHLLIDKEKQILTGIIDFGEVSIGDPAYDFAYLDLYGEDFLEKVYSSYDLVHDECFEKRRLFYKNRHMITDIRAGVKENNQERLKQSKLVLDQFLQKNN